MGYLLKAVANETDIDTEDLDTASVEYAGLHVGAVVVRDGVKAITSGDSPYTVLNSDANIVVNGTGTIIINLPNPDTYKGRRLGIIKTNATSTVTITPASGDEIQFAGTSYTNGLPLDLDGGAFNRMEVLSLGDISSTGQWVAM
jgi:hypothetical protein